MSKTMTRDDEPPVFKNVPAFKRDILTAVARLDHPSGADIRRHLTPQWGGESGEIDDPHIYQAINKLRDRGLVERTDTDGHIYPLGLTERGQQFLTGYARFVATGEIPDPDSAAAQEDESA